MQGPVLIYIVMPVVILLALFILVAVPFAGTRGSGHSLSGGRHSHGPESQDQIPGRPATPDSFGGDATDQGPCTAYGHRPRPRPNGGCRPLGGAADQENTRKVTNQPTGGTSSMS